MTPIQRHYHAQAIHQRLPELIAHLSRQQERKCLCGPDGALCSACQAGGALTRLRQQAQAELQELEARLPTVVCGFPGVGKSRAHREFGWADSDSSQFSWLDGPRKRARNPDFPRNYIEHLWGLEGIVMASTHEEVRDGLYNAGLPFLLVYPSKDQKAEYLERYRARGNDEAFILMIEQNWDRWIDALDQETRAAGRIIPAHGRYLTDFREMIEFQAGIQA